MDIANLDRVHGDAPGVGLRVENALQFASQRLALGNHRFGARRGQGDIRSLRDDNLARRITSEDRVELRCRRHAEPKLSCRHVGRGDADVARATSRAVARPERANEIVARSFQQLVGKRDARRHRLDDFAADDAPCELGIFDLLADRDAVAQLDEAAQIFLERLHRNAGERYVGGATVVPRRQRQPEDTRRDLGVVVKHLVELAHAKEQQGILVPRLDLAVLLHQRRLRRRYSRHGRTVAVARSTSVVVMKPSIPLSFSSRAAALASASVA